MTSAQPVWGMPRGWRARRERSHAGRGGHRRRRHHRRRAARRAGAARRRRGAARARPPRRRRQRPQRRLPARRRRRELRPRRRAVRPCHGRARCGRSPSRTTRSSPAAAAASTPATAFAAASSPRSTPPRPPASRHRRRCSRRTACPARSAPCPAVPGARLCAGQPRRTVRSTRCASSAGIAAPHAARVHQDCAVVAVEDGSNAATVRLRRWHPSRRRRWCWPPTPGRRSFCPRSRSGRCARRCSPLRRRRPLIPRPVYAEWGHRYWRQRDDGTRAGGRVPAPRRSPRRWATSWPPPTLRAGPPRRAAARARRDAPR